MPAESQHEFHFGDLLISEGANGGYADHGVFRLALLSSGYQVGSPAAVVSAVESQLFDGDLEEITRYGNREMTFRVEVSSTDGEGLAQGEAALMAQLGRPNTLRWLPPIPPVARTVFDVLTSTMKVDSDAGADLDELRCVRIYEITCNCMPFGRGETEVMTPALDFGTPTVSVINDCTSLTGWAPVAPIYSIALAGGIRIMGDVEGLARWTPPTSISSVGRPWLRIKWSSTMQPPGPLWVWANDEAGDATVADGPYLYKWVGPGLIENIQLGGLTAGGSSHITIEEMALQDVPPPIGTARQLARVLTVGGAAPTEGSLSLEHTSTALREVLVYANKEDGTGYQPPIRRRRVSGGTVTVDSSAMSGARSTMAAVTPETFDVPMAGLQAGDYSLMARLRATGTAGARSITATVGPRIGTSNLAPTTTSGTYDLSTAWGFYTIGQSLITIDPGAAPGGVFRVQLAADNVELDDAYLFNTTTGSLVWVDCGTGTPSAGGASNRLWIDSPTVEAPWPRIRVGTAADGSDARHITMGSIKAMSALNFPVGTMNVFTACEALNAACSLRHYERAHTNMAARS